MDGAAKRPGLAMSVIAVGASGGIWYLAGSVHHVFALAWLAPVPLLVLLADLSLPRGALAAFTASAIGGLGLAQPYFNLPLTLVASLVLLIALPYTVVAVAWRVLALRLHPALAAAWYASLVAAMEYVVALISPHGSLGAIAYSQGDVPLVLQLAAVTGLWGISFAMSWTAAALAMVWRHRQEHPLVGRLAIVAAAPVLLVVAFGAARLATFPAGRSVVVGLAASDADADRRVGMQDRNEALPVLREYAGSIAWLARRGAQIVVLPEKFVGITAEYERAARDTLAAAARDNHVMVVSGLNLIAPDELRNLAVVFAPDGRVLLDYDKQHPVPGLERGYRAGTTVGIVEAEGTVLGVAICKDLDFTALGRAYGKRGVALMLVPAWDFDGDGWMHSRMAVMRSVENGFAMARTAAQGLLTVSDGAGRIVAQRASRDARNVELVSPVVLGPGTTIYALAGDWFAWLCIAFVVLVPATRWLRRDRSG